MFFSAKFSIDYSQDTQQKFVNQNPCIAFETCMGWHNSLLGVPVETVIANLIGSIVTVFREPLHNLTRSTAMVPIAYTSFEKI